MIYWSSTKAPVHLFKREYESEEVAKVVTENSFVDAALLASDLGMGTHAIEAYQRRLGVRRITGNKQATQKWGRARKR